jgi:predicted MFS family arabinose efflux permease
MVIVNTVVIVSNNFGFNEQAVPLAFAAYGAGSMLVALALPRVLERLPDRTVMLVGAAGLVVGLCLGATVATFLWLLPVWFFLGCSSSLINTPSGRVLRRSSNEKDRPAYFAAQFSLSHACWLITYPLAGWLGVSFGMTSSFYVLTGIVTFGFTLAIFLWPADDKSVLVHVHKGLSPDNPHLADADIVQDGYQHKHNYVIDRHHRVWPFP